MSDPPAEVAAAAAGDYPADAGALEEAMVVDTVPHPGTGEDGGPAVAAEWKPCTAAPPPAPVPAPPRPLEWLTSWARWPHPCLDLRPPGPWAGDGA